MQSPQVIFISGTGRSGTNITKAIFANHDQCAALPFEYRFTIDPGGLVDFVNSFPTYWTPYIADKKLKDLETFLRSLGKRDAWEHTQSQWLKEIDPTGKNISRYPYADWELEKWMPGYLDYVDDLVSQLSDFSYRGIWPGTKAKVKQNEMYFSMKKTKEELIHPCIKFLDRCYTSFLAEQGKSVMVEDNTWNILAARDLLQMVPQGKILHIVRDPRDVIASLMDQRWCPSDVDQLIAWYSQVINQWEDQKKNLNEDQYLEVRLEDIVGDTRSVVQDMCNFTGIEYQESMAAIDLSQSNAGRYKKQFTATEIEKIEEGTRLMMDRFRY